MAQTSQLNKLNAAFKKANSKQEKLNLILKICQQNYSMAPDTLYRYLQMGKQFIKVNTANYYELELYQIAYYSKTNNSEKAILKANEMLKVNDKKLVNEDLLQKIRIEKCRAYIRNYQNTEGIESAFELLQVAEKKRDTSAIVQSYVLLGWANMELEKYAEAIKWLEKGLIYTNNQKYLLQHPSLYTNLASCYNNNGDYKSALTAINKGIYFAKLGENLTTLANAFNIRADIYIKTKRNANAQVDLEDALKVRERLGDMFYVLSDMGQLAYFYASNGQTQKGIEIAQKGIQMAEKSKQLTKLIYLYSALAENYKLGGRTNELAQTLTKMLALKDTLYQNNSEKALAELEGKYEYQKKENTILQQHYALSQSRYITIGLIVLLVLASLLFFSLYKNYQYIQKRKMVNMIQEQKELSEAAVLSAEEKERKRIAADLHDNLGAHAAAIRSGVKYFKEGLYNQNEILLQLDSNATDMVNHLNDTIWVLKNEKLHFTNLADRFKLWLQRLLPNYPNIRYHIHEQIDNNIELAPQKMLHLFLILKESVNNALRHSQCNEISIYFICTDAWEIKIVDNGKGMQLADEKDGNGIANMRQRALYSDCKIAWQSSEHGTQVIISGTTIN